MITLIEASYSALFPYEIDSMFRSRAETFRDRLDWEVVVKEGYERDRFDEENPLYLISVDPATGEYWGSLRLLPTIGPNMLRDVFPQLLSDHGVVSCSTIWESSRICVSRRESHADRTHHGISLALCELILGIAEVAILAGLTQIVSVFDARMLRVLRATGCNPKVIGTPMRVGEVMCYSALFDTGPGPLRTVRETVGISHSVMAPRADELVSLLGEKHLGRRLLAA